MKHILSVDDHPIISIGVDNILRNFIDPYKLYSAYTFKEAMELVSSQLIDLIILDLSLPDSKGIQMISKLRCIQPKVKILILSGRDERGHAPIYLAHGANGYLHKNAGRDDFEHAVTDILNNKKYINLNIKDIIVNNYINNITIPVNPLEQLSSREKEILELMLRGKLTKEIASVLDLKISTVSTHKTRILEKTKSQNVVELINKIKAYQIEV